MSDFQACREDAKRLKQLGLGGAVKRIFTVMDEHGYSGYVKHVYLVSSRARGKEKPCSDYDFAVEFDDQKMGLTSEEIDELGTETNRYMREMFDNADVDIFTFPIGGAHGKRVDVTSLWKEMMKDEEALAYV